MKRRVRIYKAGGEQGQYMNKTAQFLMKAQLGAERTSEEKMISSVTQALQQGMSPEDVYAQLLQMGIDEDSASQAIQYVVQSMQPQEEEQPEAQEGQEVQEEETNPVLSQYDTIGQGYTPEEDTEETDTTTAQEFLVPGLEDYLPEYTPMAGELEVYDVNNPFADMMYAKGGRVSKKNFVKGVLDLVKKQNGGDATPNKADSTDIPIEGRQEKFNNFLGAVKNTAQNAVLKKAAGNMYDDMMQEGGMTDQASGKFMFQGGGEDGLDLSYTDSKNVTDPYFKYGGLPRAQYGPPEQKNALITQTSEEIFRTDNNKNGIPDYLERNYTNTDTQGNTTKKSNQGVNPFMYAFRDPNRRSMNPLLNPFGNIFNYEYSYLKPTGANKNMGAIEFDPSMMPKPTNVELRRSGKVKEMDMIFDPSDKSNITSVTDMKFRRSGMPKSFTINYKGYPGSTEANPAFDFMLSKYAANKEKNAETVKSNGAPTGPRVSEDADKYDRLNVRQAKRLAKNFETPDTTWQEQIAFQTPTTPIDDSEFPTPTDTRLKMSDQVPTQTQFDPSAISRSPGQRVMFDINRMPTLQNQQTPALELQVPSKYKNLITGAPAKGFSPDSYSVMDNPGNVVIAPRTNKGQAPINTSGPTVDQEYMYGGYYAYGGDLPEYQGNQVEGKGSTVLMDPKIGPAEEAINKLTKINTAPYLPPRKVTEGITDKEGLVNIGNTPAPELEEKENSMDVKVKNAFSINPTAALDTANTLGRFAANTIQGFQDARANNKQLANYNADNLYASEAHTNRGTYDTNSGLFRPDEMGFTGVVKYGGPIYAEGGEAYMTDEDIENFLAEGGELEYIND